MLKSIFIPLSDTPVDSTVIKVALNIAAALQSDISILHGTRLPSVLPGAWGIAPELGVISDYPVIREAAQKKAEKLRAQMKTEKVPIKIEEVETYDMVYDETAAGRALCSDLVMTASCYSKDPDWAVTLSLFQTLLLNSGRPVMVVPLVAHLDMPPARVAVAWKPGREAARALHDALPFLLAADTVDVLHIAEDGIENAPLNPDPVAYLERRGIRANRVEKIKPSSATVGEAILLHVQEHGVNLLVAGGYGHTRLREWALGGVTREVFGQTTIPVLFSH